MANSVTKYLNDQPPLFKGIISVIAVAGIAYIGYEWYQGYKNKQDIASANQPAIEAGNELQQLASRGIYPSFADSEYSSWADSLREAMNGCGTNNSQVYQVFGYLRNDADIRKLIIAFGVQYYQPCWASQFDQWTIYQFDNQHYGGNLPTWLSYDMSASEIAKVNSTMSANGITYQF
jgi:hypothetical protein